LSTPPDQTPPPPPPPPQQTQPWERPSYGYGMPQLPALNGELVVFLLLLATVGIVTLASDRVDADGFVTAAVLLAVGYMVSRGIAKAGKVWENR
jgi:hypothetical protein